MRKQVKYMIVLTALALVLAPLSPAQGQAAGAFAFEGGVTVATEGASLPQFPCDPAEGDTGCNGTFAGGISGSFTDGTRAAAIADGTLTAAFGYVEPYDLCPAQGTAGGSINFSGSGPGGSVTGSGSFTWQRLGGTAAITATASVRVNGGPPTSVEITAEAEFEPRQSVATRCPNLGGTPQPTEATVVGQGVAAAV